MLIIDCQVHPFLANTPQRPWATPHDDGRNHVTADEMVMAMDAVGVDGAIAVSPRGMYGFDPSYAVEVQRAHPDRFAIVRPVDPNNPAVGESIAEWKRTAGAVAVRLMLGAHLGVDPNPAGADVIAQEPRGRASRSISSVRAISMWRRR
jgi:predicted TIM-barrel fold metal-dependent hydrolase